MHRAKSWEGKEQVARRESWHFFGRDSEGRPGEQVPSILAKGIQARGTACAKAGR